LSDFPRALTDRLSCQTILPADFPTGLSRR
jgi:hypothetical protein